MLQNNIIKSPSANTKYLQNKLKEAEDARAATMNILEDIEDARKQLELEDIKKNELFNITSHELKTPLVPIQGYLDLIEKGTYGQLTDKQKEILEIVDRNVKRLAKLISDVLDIARIQSKKMKFDIELIDPSSLIKESAEGMQSAAKNKNLSIKVTVEKLDVVYVDKQRLVQVITNIIGNAIKFTGKGGVAIHAYCSGKNIYIDISDTGIGIKPEDQDRIFEKFYQVDSTLTRKYGGTGLGLAISKGIMRSLGGDIIFKSQFGKGSRFTIIIPNHEKVKKTEFDLYGFVGQKKY